jgi:hypothetical protein
LIYSTTKRKITADLIDQWRLANKTYDWMGFYR